MRRMCALVPSHAVRKLTSSATSTCVTLAVAGFAVAGVWGWQGNIGGSSHFNNGACPWYSSDSACSTWNYWTQINAANQGGDTILAGFETSSVVRGRWFDSGQSGIVYPSGLGMGGWYMKGHTTWCYAISGAPCWIGGGGNGTYVWFQVTS